MILRLLPLLIAAAGAAKNKNKIAQFLEMGTIPAVQIEMSNICKVIHLYSIDGSQPSTDPNEFAEFVKKNIKAQTKDINRDFSKDMWGSQYRLQLVGNIATVLSAGPDKQFGTSDDLRSSTELF